ncbi:hypothetical protein UPYG_G00087840 [Umbra pygmaea]|uniref:Ricin B lectin domain-containing protein n=1 Tax=Umbra pygmaea TaxID=75934 RepID=A0ABD0XIF6_UMBPY
MNFGKPLCILICSTGRFLLCTSLELLSFLLPHALPAGKETTSENSCWRFHSDMSCVWITLCFLLTGASSFMIYNTYHGLCLENNPKTGLVQLKRCNLDSDVQQWIWIEQSVLQSVGTSRCLSASHPDPVQTVPCEGVEDWYNMEAGELQWGCELNRLISKNSSLELSTDGKRLTLSRRSKQTKWRSLDEGDICQDRLRSKRASSKLDTFEVESAGQQEAEATVMTDEQREFLRWYYRTEDPTIWKFAMLSLSFAALLIGCILLGMGFMADKNRKKIAKYKSAALAMTPEAEELQVIVTSVPAQVSIDQSASPVSKPKPILDNGETKERRPGDIVLTWKDGNVSSLYGEGDEVEEVEKKEVSQNEMKDVLTIELVEGVDEGQ